VRVNLGERIIQFGFDGAGGEMAEFNLRIEGMHCGSCVRRVNQALAALDGIEVSEVRVGAARFTAPDEQSAEHQALSALANIGFTAHVER